MQLPSQRQRFVLLAVASFVYRLLWLPGRYLEMDGSMYLRAAADYARHFVQGDWTRVPLSNEFYTAVEYWPPLYPVLSGLLQAASGLSSSGAAQAVSWWAGWLTLWPVYAIARRLWGPREAWVATALVALSPSLAWYATVPRCESLFLLLFMTGVACAVGAVEASTRPGIGMGAAAGAALALAYMTRFEAVAAALACLVAMALLSRSRRVLPAMAALALAFGLVAAPYVGYLSHLDGGRLSLVTPQKKAYDSLEGVWSVQRIGMQSEFIDHYGPPGLVRVDERDPLTVRLRGYQGALLGYSLPRLPWSVRAAASNWLALVVFLGGLTMLRERRDRRVQALAALFALALVQAVLMFWDPSPRYYGFTFVLWSLLAAPRAVALWDAETLRTPVAVLYGLVPILIFSAWYVPTEHFEMPGSLFPWLQLPWDAMRVEWLMIAAGVGGGLLATAFGAPGPLRAAVVLAVAGQCLVPAWRRWTSSGLDDPFAPAMLGVLGIALAAFFLPGRRGQWHRRYLAACGAAMVLAGAQNLVAMKAADTAYALSNTSSAVADYLRDHTELGTVLAPTGFDVIRSGSRWIPLKARGADLDGEAVRAAADAVVLLETAPRADTAVLRLAASFPVATARCRMCWNVYRRRLPAPATRASL